MSYCNYPGRNITYYYVIPRLNDYKVFKSMKDAELYILDRVLEYDIDLEEIDAFLFDNVEKVRYDELSVEQLDYLLDRDNVWDTVLDI